MGLFDWLVGGKQKSPGKAPGMIVVLDGLPDVDVSAATKALAAIEPLRLPLKLEVETGKGTWQASAAFDSHDVGIAGFDARVPDAVMEKTVQVSNWTGPGRESLEGHSAHLVLMHGGGHAKLPEEYMALYKLPAVLGGQKLAGVLIQDPGTCPPPNSGENSPWRKCSGSPETPPPSCPGFWELKRKR